MSEGSNQPFGRRGRRRRVAFVLKWLLVIVGVLVIVLVIAGWTAFGRRAEGPRRARMEKSSQWRDGVFANPQTIINDERAMIEALFSASPHASPTGPLPFLRVEPNRIATRSAGDLRVTWLGHSSTLIEIGEARILTDPIWSERASPFSWIGPKRWYPPLIALSELPAIDAVVISHDHYDHLDQRTIAAMRGWSTKFIVPLGVGAHLAYWGVPESNIVELDWWERARVRDVEIVATPARHASGRTLFDRDAKLWAGYALVSEARRVWYSGDTGLFPAMEEIGARLGPFDVTMIESGQYHGAWPDWHLGPEQAVEAHRLVRGRVMLPVHWGLFQLAMHGWTEPIERVLAAAARVSVVVVTPRPGQSIDFETAPPPVDRWWPSLT